MIPVPKFSSSKTVERDLRVVSLTLVHSKELKFFIIMWLLMKLARDQLDPSQFGVE